MAIQQVVNLRPLLCIAFKYRLATVMCFVATYCRGQLETEWDVQFLKGFSKISCANYKFFLFFLAWNYIVYMYISKLSSSTVTQTSLAEQSNGISALIYQCAVGLGLVNLLHFAWVNSGKTFSCVNTECTGLTREWQPISCTCMSLHKLEVIRLWNQTNPDS